MIPIVLVLFLVNRGSVFYIEKRPGKNEKLFAIIKLKTMTDAVDVDGALLPDEKRLTKFGNVIRRLSLDEVPQLVNVLKGEMSLIGPRPLRVEYLELYSEEQKKRHEVRPGITGWAQVNGRNSITWKEKLAFDVWYVDHVGLLLDLKIVILTFLTLFQTGDVYANKDRSSHRFTGNN
jgi:lipopolysaccharide/colanic/teichoic acid biosynthesis glycosyltransferase